MSAETRPSMVAAGVEERDVGGHWETEERILRTSEAVNAIFVETMETIGFSEIVQGEVLLLQRLHHNIDFWDVLQ